MLVLYLGFAATLVIVGRRGDARALSGFVPDCLVLFRRLLADRRLSGRRKLLLAAVVVYLVMPFDLVPDFVPVAGQLDDALIVAIVLGMLLWDRPDLLRRHWPGPTGTLTVVMRLASGGRRLTTGRAGGPHRDSRVP